MGLRSDSRVFTGAVGTGEPFRQAGGSGEEGKGTRTQVGSTCKRVSGSGLRGQVRDQAARRCEASLDTALGHPVLQSVRKGSFEAS